MPWNEPGKNDQDPWGGKRDSNPPDLDKIISNFIKKLRNGFFKPGKTTGNWQAPAQKDYGVIAGFVLAGILVLWFLSGIFIVNPAEETVVLRFGKYNDTLQPGLHWIARFIDTKYTVDVRKVFSFSLSGDFLTKSSEQGDLPNQYIQVDANKKSTSPDQSKNLVNVELNIQYRVADPRAYLFNIVNPDETMKQVSSGALSDVIGKMKLDDVLTTGREVLSAGVLDRSKQILSTYQSGLEVVAVTLRKVQAPDQVREAFNDVNRADQDRSTTIQQAQAYASKVVPLAEGQAARISADANGYRQQVVLNAKANVARYQALLKAYESSPEVTRERLYLDAMQNILKSTSKILIDSNSGNNLIYLPLDKLMKQIEDDDASNSSTNTPTPISGLVSNDNSSSTEEVKNDTN